MNRTFSKTPSLRARFFGFLVLCCTFTSCADVEDPRAFEENLPPIRLLFVLPNDEQSAAAVDSRIEFCWSTRLDPRSVRPGSANLSSGLLNFDSDLEVQLFPWRVPVIGTALAEEAWCPGTVISVTPQTPLTPGIKYRIRMSGRIRGWAGEELDASTPGWIEDDQGDTFYYHEFTVADSSARTTANPNSGLTQQKHPFQISFQLDHLHDRQLESERPSRNSTHQPDQRAPAYTLRQLFSAGQIFDPNLQRCSCHLDSSSPAMGRLDLRSAEKAFPTFNQRIMSTGFPMVAPRRPSDSYLIQKLLKTDDGQAIHLVRGSAMPPESSLAHVELASIARWIADGATL